MKEVDIFKQIQHHISQCSRNKVFRIGINGIEGTGKTTFAQKLSSFLSSHFAVYHVSIDGFHFNREYRYKQGRNSAKGYYEDSYQEEYFLTNVLLSSQKNPPTIVTRCHNLTTDEYLDEKPLQVEKDALIITEGCYLFKPLLLPHWDYKIYLYTDVDTARARGVKRDSEALGGPAKAEEKYRLRYHKASSMYQELNNPLSHSDLIIDNTNFNDLKLIKNNYLPTL